MERNKLSVVPSKTYSPAEKATSDVDVKHFSTEEAFAMMNQMANAIIMLDKQVHALSDILDKRVTVSSTQARSIADAVKRHALAVCERYALDYTIAGKSLREAIWRAIRSTYQVPSHYDLPEKYYSSTLTFIENWIPSFVTVKKLRERQ